MFKHYQSRGKELKKLKAENASLKKRYDIIDARRDDLRAECNALREELREIREQGQSALQFKNGYPYVIQTSKLTPIDI